MSFGFGPITPINTDSKSGPWPKARGSSPSREGNEPTNPSLPTDVAALHSIINSLQGELKAITSVNTHLAASVARLQAEQATTPPTRAKSVLPCTHPDDSYTTATGRGAASPEIFNKMIKTNRNGSLGRAHMVDVDALPPAALLELDSLLKRRLRNMFPYRSTFAMPNVDEVFVSLAVLGLRLDDSGRYVDFPVLDDDTMLHDSMAKRARHLSGYYYANHKFKHEGYWRGILLETLTELARYRGLFDDEGFLREE